MAELLSNLGSLIQDVILAIGYPGIAVVMFLENVFPPIPSELVLPYSGFLVGQGKFHWFGVWLASVVGALVGALTLYQVGKWASDHLVRNLLNRYGRWLGVSEADYNRALGFFDRYGDIIVFVGRLIPIIRSIISIPAGANHMPMPKFLAYTAIGAGIWNGILIGAGIWLGDQWEQVMEVVASYQHVTIAILVIGFVIFVALRLWARFKTPKPVVVES